NREISPANRGCNLTPHRESLRARSALWSLETSRQDVFFFSSRRRHTRSVSAFLLNRSSDLNVYVGFMVWSNFTATKCRGLVSLSQVIKEIICLQPLK